MSQSHRVTGPEAETAGIRFKLATATTKSNTRSRRPRTRSRPGFFLPVGMGLATLVLPFNFATYLRSSLVGFARLFRPRYALANLGHPSQLAKVLGDLPVQLLKARERTAVSA